MKRHASLLHGIRHFFGWWRRELQGLLPLALQRRLDSGRGRWVMTLEGSQVRVLRQTGGREMVVAQVDLTSHRKAGWSRLKRLSLVGPFGQARRMRLRLPAAEALHTQVTLPLAAEENLDEVLGFELDRLTPFRPKDVFLRHRIEGRDSAAGTLKVDLTILRRSAAEAALAAMAKLGIEIDGLEVASGRVDRPAELLFRNPEARPVGPAALTLRVVMGLAVVIAIAAIGVGIREQDQKVDALRQQVADGKRVVDEVQALKAQIGRLEDKQNAAAARNGDSVPVNQVLFQLTQLLPDDTWLERLRVTEDKVVLSCLSGSSSRVIRLLEGSTLFRNPTLSSQVVHDAKGRDQFELTVSLGGAQK